MNGEWISVSDKLPEYGTPVLAFVGGFYRVAILESSEPSEDETCPQYDYWYDEFDEDIDYTGVTHWMAIPPAPYE